jgi:hypothetical protein
MNPRTFNRTLRGELSPRVPDDKSVPIVDNLVPGPGTHDPNYDQAVPNFKICSRSPRTKQFLQWESETAVKSPVGPQTYTPNGPGLEKGVRFNQSLRQDEKGTFMQAPAPNRYKVLGDFDFKDQTDTKNSVGKIPKFAFGNKPNVKPRGIDVPGPGTYETDVLP